MFPLLRGGGIIVGAPPLRKFRLHNLNRNNQIEVRSNSSSGTPLAYLNPPTSSIDFDTLVDTTQMWLAGNGAAQDAILQPIGHGLSDALACSPLAFWLKATDSNARLLMGSFYSSDGRILLMGTPASPTVQFSFAPTATPKTLYQFVKDSYANFPLFADCWEFRGTLYGGPVQVTPDSYLINFAQSAYHPDAGAPIINPGPVRLGGDADSIWQPSTNPGFMDPGVGKINGGTDTGTTITAGAVSADLLVDVRSSALGVLHVSWTQSSTRNLRVQLWRQTTTLGSSPTTFTSQYPSVDEVFSPTSGTSHSAHVELEDGLYKMVLSVPSGSGNATDVYWTVQRFQ